MSLEKISNPLNMRHWLGDMEADYVYTLGVAGERFFKELKRGRIVGAKCGKCGLIYVPPKMYCEECFTELKDWIDVGKKGEVYTFTIATIDVDGKKLGKPEIYALVKFHGTHGGLIHRIAGTDTVTIGMRVQAVFQPISKRKASINDIACFKPMK